MSSAVYLWQTFVESRVLVVTWGRWWGDCVLLLKYMMTLEEKQCRALFHFNQMLVVSSFIECALLLCLVYTTYMMANSYSGYFQIVIQFFSILKPRPMLKAKDSG